MIRMLEQHQLKITRELVSPRSKIDSLVKAIDEDKLQRPLLVRGEDGLLVDGLRRLRAVQEVGYHGPLQCQVIDFDEAGYDALEAYLTKMKQEQGPQSLERLYEIYQDLFGMSRAINSVAKQVPRGTPHRQFPFFRMIAANAERPWKFGDYVGVRRRLVEYADEPEVKKALRLMATDPHSNPITVVAQLARKGIIPMSSRELREYGGVVELQTEDPPDGKAQLRVLTNVSHQLESITRALADLGVLDPEITFSGQLEISEVMYRARLQISKTIKQMEGRKRK